MAFDFSFNALRAGFFDTQAVMRQVERARRRVLSKFGAYVRTRARRSIRKRKGISKPGSPPSSHEGSLRKLIFFAFDPSHQSVVIGPVQFKKGDAPRLLEHGGIVARTDKSGTTRTMRYRPRPFIFPAAMAEAENFPSLLRSMVH